MPRQNQIQFRKGTYSQWNAQSSTVLGSGEPGFITDFNKLKIGDGSTQWSDLAAINDALTTLVYNGTASTIPKMSVVYINGAQGDMPSIRLSIASGEMTSSKTYGITTNAISAGGTGMVVVDGALKNLNTSPTFDGITPGTTLWLSPTVSGGITTTKPSGPNHMVSVGNLVRIHNQQGIINVKIQNGFELEELHNVAVSGVSDGQFLQYNSGSGLWVPSSSGSFNYLSSITGVTSGLYVRTSPDSNFVNLSNVLTIDGDNYLKIYGGAGGLISTEDDTINAFQLLNGTIENSLIGFSIPNSGIFTNLKADTFTSTKANNINIGSGQIYLNGNTGNRIDFNASGIGAPAFTNNRSVGTKIVLSPNTSSTQTEYALGIEAGAMWFSVPIAASRAFKWYAGTAGIATLLGNGTLTINGSTSQINVDDLRLDNNILSITTANTDLILSPNGNGSLLADPSGNARGVYSNDFQRERTSVSGVAAGSYSVICGGSDNRAANSYSTIAGGQSNIASNTWTTIAGGDSNTSSGSKATVGGGGNNLASALSATVAGGSNNEASGSYAIVPGGFRAKATRQGELSHAAGFFNAIGDAQHTVLIARRLTTDATANVVLTLNGLAPVSTNILNISAQTMWTFSIKLSAYNLTNNEGAWWIFRGGIRRNNSNGTALVGSLISENDSESSLSAATASVVADDTNEALEIRANGIAGKSIRWVAVVDISQVSYGTP